MPTGGRDGYIGYYEGPHAASFYWEIGGDDVVVILHVDQSSGRNTLHPWAAGRQHEILERVIQEVIRQRAPTCKADIDETGGCIYLREHKYVA